MSYVLLTAFLSILSITFKHTPTVLIEAVSIVTFLFFGLINEIIFTQLAIILLLLSLSHMIKLYDNSIKNNEILHKVSEFGCQLSGRLKISNILDLFLEKTSVIIPVDYLYILDIVEGKELRVIRGMEDGQVILTDPDLSVTNDVISAKVVALQTPILFHSKKEWGKYHERYLPGNVESMIIVPVIGKQKAEMVVVLASSQKKKFNKMHLKIIQLLSYYLGAAMENARYYKTTKNHSERCSLTHLYNYRYFEKVLKKEFDKLNQTEITTQAPLSLILIDIDHFKTINDTYGHQSGNEILVELAARLIEVVGDIGTVARYGGEEFVILLPDTDKFTCYRIAETVRQMIANRPFSLQDDLKETGEDVLVRITASVGIATAPDDAEEAFDLVRHADRAMYTGAKQAGRNRVAEYVK